LGKMVDEIIEYLRRKASEEAIEWAKDKKILTGKYPSTEEVLRFEGMIYDSYISELRRWLCEIKDEVKE